MNAPSLSIDGIIIPVRIDPVHEYTLTTAEVAAGYGVSPKTIRNHKANHADELVEGKHFFGAQNLGSENLMDVTHWTKRGIVRLGFFIRSERAQRFRDLAEDLVLREIERPAAGHSAAALVSVVGELVAEVRALREALAATKTARPAVAAPRGYRHAPDRLDEARRFFAACVEAGDLRADRLPVGVLLPAYLAWCRREGHLPRYHVDKTLAKALRAAIPHLRGRWRRCAHPSGRREVCYLGYRLRRPLP